MSKHTPGPWKAVYVGCSDWDLDGPTTQEDWTLAAAAPDLLEALRRLIATGLDERTHHEFMSDPVHYARVAIAKATGEQT